MERRAVGWIDVTVKAIQPRTGRRSIRHHPGIRSGFAMPLTRAPGRPVFKRDGVRFLMRDGPDEVPCSVSYRALLAFGRTVGMDDSTIIFVAYRDQIERAASDKYDRTARADYEVVTVMADDLSGGSQGCHVGSIPAGASEPGHRRSAARAPKEKAPRGRGK
jgi:hypothetical protein